MNKKNVFNKLVLVFFIIKIVNGINIVDNFVCAMTFNKVVFDKQNHVKLVENESWILKGNYHFESTVNQRYKFKHGKYLERSNE